MSDGPLPQCRRLNATLLRARYPAPAPSGFDPAPGRLTEPGARTIAPERSFAIVIRRARL